MIAEGQVVPISSPTQTNENADLQSMEHSLIRNAWNARSKKEPTCQSNRRKRRFTIDGAFINPTRMKRKIEERANQPVKWTKEPTGPSNGRKSQPASQKQFQIFDGRRLPSQRPFVFYFFPFSYFLPSPFIFPTFF